MKCSICKHRPFWLHQFKSTQPGLTARLSSSGPRLFWVSGIEGQDNLEKKKRPVQLPAEIKSVSLENGNSEADSWI